MGFDGTAVISAAEDSFPYYRSKLTRKTGAELQTNKKAGPHPVNEAKSAKCLIPEAQ